MKAVIQRVSSAKVKVHKSSVAEIGNGYFVLLGIEDKDKLSDAEILAEKVVKLRVMADNEGKMNLNLENSQGEVLVVSQFTLVADTGSGNRPSFINAAKPKKAEKLYKYFIKILRNSGLSVKTGKFGEYMIINSVLDGPVTILF